MRLTRQIALLWILTTCSAPCWAAITFKSLLNEMTDMEALTRMPDPAYAVKQFSSYDQRSKNREILTDEDWFANGDRGQYLRKEEREGAVEFVLMESDGPGAIVRFWSANPDDAGIVRIYLDGKEAPAIEMPLSDLLGGRQFPFIPPISAEASRGWNSYLPVPYAKHCKVTTSEPDFYYQINYRTYKSGTSVQSYSAKAIKRNSQLIDSVADALARPGQMPRNENVVRVIDASKSLPVGGSIRMDGVRGPAALYSMRTKVDAGDVEAALRGIVLEVRYDGESAPRVQVPLGDFFGTAPGANPYASVCSHVSADGTLHSRWVMPYRDAASVTLTNHSGEDVTLTFELASGAYRWKDDSLYFHAKWRSEYPIHTRPRQDWNYLTATGKGRFVGDMLHVTNPVKDWWGEGDEKIYVDGEPFPSHFGTGTEDYYGYAWCCPEVFTHAYHNQPRCDGPGNYGQTCVSRYHILDNIPFNESFKFDMEVWHWAECDIAMAATSYWYADPESDDGFEPIPLSALKVIAPPPPPPPKRVSGALEGEEMKIAERTGGVADTQSFDGWGWSNAAQVWWRAGKPGDRLTLAFPVDKAGKYEMLAVFTTAVDYGVIKLSVNGIEIEELRDFYHDGVMATPEQSLGVFDLREGENVLTAEIIGTNPKAIPQHMFGLDYVLLRPAS